jgi:hypothetical protein
MSVNQTAIEFEPREIRKIGDGEQLIRHLTEVMGALLEILEEETAVIRAGRLSEAAKLEPTKADLARLYLSDVERLKNNLGFLRQNLPDSLQSLSRHHDTFYAVLQINLAVLATAHAVSESIIRGVAEELSRKSAPRIYGSSGQSSTASSPAAPVVVSRSL